MEEDCSLVFTTSRGQVKIAPTVPPHLEQSSTCPECKEGKNEDERGEKENEWQETQTRQQPPLAIPLGENREEAGENKEENTRK